MKAHRSARAVRAIATAGCVLALAHAHAVTVASYTFTGNSLASSDTDPGSTAGDFTVGAGFTGFAAPASFFVNSPAMMVASDHTVATESDAITASDYFSFTVAPSGGGTLKFGQLTYNLAHNNNSNTITVSVSVRWSVDHFAAPLGTATRTVNSGQTMSAGAGVDLSSFAAQSGPVEFRFYVFDDQNTQFSQDGIDTITLDAASIPAPPRYRVIDLGTLGGDASSAAAINAAGQIVGDAKTRRGQTHAFVFQSGRMRDLGVLGGTESHATAVNSLGQVAGVSTVSNANGDLHACLFANGRRTDLGTLAGGDSNSRANAINTAGTVAGQSDIAGGDRHAVSFGTSVTDLAPAGAPVSEALAINSAGVIVGYTVADPVPQRAVIFSGGSAQDIGVLGGGAAGTALCTAINDAGVIVGSSSVDATPNHGHAFIYNGTMSDLGTLDGDPSSNSSASGINNKGQVVGVSAVGGGVRGFLYADGVIRDLAALAAGNMGAFTTLTPAAINDDGWIVGSGGLANGQTHAFLAVPGAYKNALVVAKGDTATGITDAEFSVLGPPVIDAAGGVAFRATVRGTSPAAGIGSANNAGIWHYATAGSTLIARTGDPAMAAPGTGGAVFKKLGDPILASDGTVAFIGTLKTGTGDATAASATGVWRYGGGTLSLVARVGDGVSNAPSGVKITAIDSIAIDGRGLVSFLVKLKGIPGFVATGAAIIGTSNDGTRVLLDRVDDTVKGLTAFKPLPSVAGQGRTVATDGHVAHLRAAKGGPVSILLAAPVLSTFAGTTVKSTGTTLVPFIDATISALGEPAVNASGAVAFTMSMTGHGATAKSNFAIALEGSANDNLPARTGFPAPDAAGAPGSAVFAKLSSPVLNNKDRIAFVGTLSGDGVTGSTNSGVWSDADGTLKLVVREGDAAPGYGGGKFASFDQIVLPDAGGVATLATLSGVPAARNRGVWAFAPNGKLGCVVREGDALTVDGTLKTVKKLGIFQLAPGVMGQSRSFDASTGSLVYSAAFTDGSSAILKLTFP